MHKITINLPALGERTITLNSHFCVFSFVLSFAKACVKEFDGVVISDKAILKSTASKLFAEACFETACMKMFESKKLNFSNEVEASLEDDWDHVLMMCRHGSEKGTEVFNKLSPINGHGHTDRFATGSFFEIFDEEYQETS